MKAVLVLLIAATGAWAQQGSLLVGTATMPTGALTSALIVFEPTGHDFTEICRIESSGLVKIAKGKEQQCWEKTVQAHNSSMNSPASHREMDKNLEIMRARLGKPRTPQCAPPAKAK